MAYNPFNIFRRNQRAIFAVVTVFIMFTFVLSSGLGGKADFFDWFPDWIGSKKKGEVVCTIDGSKVYSHTLDRLKFQRAVAGRYMDYAAAYTLEGLQKSLLEQMAQGSPEFKMYFQLAMQNPMMAAGLTDMVANNPKAKQADKDAAKTLEAMISLSQSRFRSASAGTYFANVPNRNYRDLVEFTLWERKAKDLGIDFSSEDVKKSLIAKEFLGTFSDDPRVRARLRDDFRDRFNEEMCFDALAAEFRVRAAQMALLGPVSEAGRTLTAAPIFNTPFELFDFYRDKTSPTAYEVLAVPDSLFMSQVTATPTDDELQRLFAERKDYEPDPAREEAGFKEPRRVKVEWVSVTGEEPYYQKLAAQSLAQGPIAAALVPPTLGVWGTLAVAPVAASDPVVYSRYKTTVLDRHEGKLRFTWDGTSTHVVPFDVIDANIVRAQNLAAAAGGGAGLAVGFGSPLLPSNLLVGATISAEQRARVKACMPLVLGVVPGPAMLATAVGGEAAFRKNQPAALPVEAYKPELLKTLTEQKARDLAVADLKKLRDEVDKLTENGKKKDKSEAKAYIAEFVKARGIKTGGTTDFQSEWTIGDDPGMAPLKAVKDKGLDGTDPHAAMRGAAPLVQFGQKFFWSTAGMGAPKTEAKGVYTPEFYPERAAETAVNPLGGKPDPVFLAWRTDEQQAKAVAFSAARPKVIEAWKRVRARDLAKAEAERLAGELRAKPASSEFFVLQDMTQMQGQLRAKATDPKAQDRVKLFRIDNVAPYPIPTDPTGAVRPFQVTPTENIPYPTPDMTKVLLEDRTKPNTVLVQADQPKDTFYVVALLERKVRGEAEFREHMFDRLGRSQVQQQLLGAYRMEAGRRAHDSILAMLKQEYKYVETEEQKKKLDDREKRGSDE